MTLYNIVSILKSIAASQPNIRTTTDGSVYDALNTNPAIQYDVFHISQTNHREDENYDYYGFNLFYISRLEDSLEDNRLQIQSIGKEVLSNIIRTLCENFAIDYPTITYFPFTQKFNDLCAGVYCSIQLDVPKEIWCADDYIAEVVPGSGLKLQDIGITITQNGLIVITPDAEYDGIGEIRIETIVPQSTAVLQDKEVEYTENGSYTIYPDSNYDGLSSVSVDVDVPDRYDEGYDDGVEDQKAKMVATAITENGEYNRTDGYSAITVNVPQGQGYEEGYEDGEAAQKAKMVSLSVTANGQYDREDGYSAVTVNVPSDYQDGYDDGAADQKAKLVATSFTENNTYTIENGWSAVTVNVPQTGYTEEDLERAYQEGYDDGLNDCGGWDHKATALTIDVADTIIGNGVATYDADPYGAVIDPLYSSDDTSKATIDPVTGAITVLEEGVVTFCVRDTRTDLQSCKAVNVQTGGTQYNVLDFIYETTGANQTNWLFVGQAQTDNDYFYQFYSAITAMEIDGVTVQKDPANIHRSYPRTYDYYFYTFPTAGRHNVKYYLSKNQLPSVVLNNLIFADNLGTLHLVEANIGSGFQKIYAGVFQGTEELTAVTIPNTVKELGYYTFQYSGLLNVTIPDSVTVIKQESWLNSGLFDHCTSLTSATIGTGLTSIPNHTFSGCTALTTVTMNRTTPPSLGTNVFKDCASLQNIYVPAAAVNAYKTAWPQYANIIQAKP